MLKVPRDMVLRKVSETPLMSASATALFSISTEKVFDVEFASFRVM